MLTFRLKAAALLLFGFLNSVYAGAPPMAIEASAKGISRLDVRFTYKDKELSRFEFKGSEGVATGAITLPTEVNADYEITAYDQEGRVSHSGKGTLPASHDDDRPLLLPVPPAGDADGLIVSVTRERIVLTVKPGESNQINVHADIYDPYGNPVKFDPLEIRWGLSDPRDIKLVPLDDPRDVVLVPNKGVKLERLCITPPDVSICTINGHCRPIPICSDPWTTVS